MVKILSLGDTGENKENPLIVLWESFTSADRLTRLQILAAVLMMFVTPFITGTFLILGSHAASTGGIGTAITQSLYSKSGPKKQGTMVAASACVTSPPLNYIVNSELITELSLINQFRAQNGQTQLTASVTLSNAAQWKAQDMATNDYFSHNDRNGRDLASRLASFGYGSPCATLVGENIEWWESNPLITISQVMTNFENSPEHRANLLSSRWKAIGLGFATVAAGSVTKGYWVEDFGDYLDRPANYVTSNPIPSPIPTPTPVKGTPTPSPVCTPSVSCTTYGYTCGTLYNGCGNISCGSCSAGYTCSSSTGGTCVYTPTPTPPATGCVNGTTTVPIGGEMCKGYSWNGGAATQYSPSQHYYICTSTGWDGGTNQTASGYYCGYSTGFSTNGYIISNYAPCSYYSGSCLSSCSSVLPAGTNGYACPNGTDGSTGICCSNTATPTPSPVCTPSVSCTTYGYTCGTLYNGCGNISCGSCSAGYTCSSSTGGTCVYTPTPTPASCCPSDSRVGPGAPGYTTPDNCGSFDYNCDGRITPTNAGGGSYYSSYGTQIAHSASLNSGASCTNPTSTYDYNFYSTATSQITSANCGQSVVIQPCSYDYYSGTSCSGLIGYNACTTRVIACN